MGKISKIIENAKKTFSNKEMLSFSGIKNLYQEKLAQKHFDNEKDFVTYSKVPKDECFVDFIGKDEKSGFVYIKYNEKF